MARISGPHIVFEERQTRCACGVLVGYTPSDWYYNDIGHGGEGVRCPSCDKYLPVRWGDLPSHWQNEILNINDIRD